MCNCHQKQHVSRHTAEAFTRVKYSTKSVSRRPTLHGNPVNGRHRRSCLHDPQSPTVRFTVAPQRSCTVKPGRIPGYGTASYILNPKCCPKLLFHCICSLVMKLRTRPYDVGGASDTRFEAKQTAAPIGVFAIGIVSWME